MANELVLQEAKAVLSTFKLISDRPAFSPQQAKALKEQKTASTARVKSLVNEIRSPLLREDAQKFGQLRRDIVKESIRLERLTIMEAASGFSVGQMAEQLHGMVAALQPMMSLSEGLAAVVSHKAQTAEHLAMELEDLEGSGMGKEFGSKMEEFKKVFGDLGVVVKGLIALADDLSAGPLGELLQPVMAWVAKRKQKQTSLLETLAAYDAEVNKVVGKEGVPVKQGYFSKLFTHNTGPAKSDMAGRVKKAIEEVVKSKAPGFAKVAASLGGDLMEKPLRQIFSTFKAFDEAVANNVDTDFLMKMTKQSFGSALKGLVGGFFSGQGGMGSRGMGGSAH